MAPLTLAPGPNYKLYLSPEFVETGPAFRSLTRAQRFVWPALRAERKIWLTSPGGPVVRQRRRTHYKGFPILQAVLV